MWAGAGVGTGERGSKSSSLWRWMRSSVTSTRRAVLTRRPGNQPSAWTPRRRARRDVSDWRAGVAASGRACPGRQPRLPRSGAGKAIPYGIDDLAANPAGSTSARTMTPPQFAAESIRRWWNSAGQAAYPGARRRLVTADAGGSNGYLTRAWKTELAAFARETGLAVTACHFPPGMSKRNKRVWPGGRPGAMKCSRCLPGAVAVSIVER